MKKIRYAIIGFGGIAENRVAKEGFGCDKSRFNGLKKAVLVGATDMNPARQAAAEALGLKWYANSDAILADKTIDAVYIATNNATHATLAIAALDAGKHVIVEKPAATSVADARKMVKLAAEKKLSLSVDHMMVNNAWNMKAQKMVSAGKLGKVNDSCFHMEFAYGYEPAEAATWRCSRIEEMGGPIGDVASHCFYVAEFIFGKKITKIAAVYYPKVMKIKAEDGAYIKFFLEDGTQGSVRASFSEMRGGLAGTLTNLGFEVYGDKAVLRSFGTMFQLSGHDGEPVKMRLAIDNGKEASVVAPEKIRNIYQTLIEKHAASVQDGKAINAEDAVHNLALCAAAHKSAQTAGKIISVKD